MSYEEILAGNPQEFGSPDQPTARGFVRLAQAGKEIWNAWRKDYPAYRDEQTKEWHRHIHWIDTNAQPIQLAPSNIDFSEFNFGDGANFLGQSFSPGRVITFERAKFGDDTGFRDCTFNGGMNFRSAAFGNRTQFFNVNVVRANDLPNDAPFVAFDNATFGDQTEFNQVRVNWGVRDTSDNVVSFQECKFGDNSKISFLNDSWLTFYNFGGVVFGSGSDFSNVNFGRLLSLKNGRFRGHVSFRDSVISEGIFDHCRFGTSTDFSGKAFGPMSFKFAVFAGHCDFTNREFKSETTFKNAQFGKVPIFHDCQLHQDTEFTCDESFPLKPEGTSTASRAYRTLKLAMNQHQATREEQFFFRREMREERAELWKSKSPGKRLRSALYYLYEKFSDYGSSVIIPFIWLVFAWIIAAGSFAAISPEAQLWIPFKNSLDFGRTLQWLVYSIATSVPLTGLDETARNLGHQIGANANSAWFTAILFLHKTITLLFLFLMILAVRNAFKMK